jgi:5'-nucleotidase
MPADRMLEYPPDGPSERSSPLVLLSNDDGHRSPGIRAMRDALRAAGADVVLVAPEYEQSASSHSLSLRRPLRLYSEAEGHFYLDGTPADCVYVALHAKGRILPRKPDLVVSGINYGMNLGQDAFYSGTIAAAREAALRGIPALATSGHPSLDLAVVAAFSARVAFAVLHAARAARAARARGCLLNLNVPPGWTGQLRATRLGARIYEEIVDFRFDPRGAEYLWLGGPGVRHERDPGTDTDAYDDGIASLTPLLLDLTNGDDAGIAATVAQRAVATP